ncbi:MAG: hypothetical protein CVU40_13410 [Chloroflexi bacterium HGW-Chloroflexi-2]|nr:MAG: hypothetical protein CVU40_13410 [Chloroflexi bacterium HGW-Chloroflexi-2]
MANRPQKNFSNILMDALVIMPIHIRRNRIVLISDGVAGTGKGKAFDFWLYQKILKHNHSTDQNKTINHGSNALPRRLASETGFISEIVQNFKSITSHKINKLLNTPGLTI